MGAKLPNGRVVGREPCPLCHSRDNVAVYDNGGRHCFSVGCDYHVFGEGVEGDSYEFVPRKSALEMSGIVQALPDRKISKATCKKFGVTSDNHADGTIAHHWYPLYNLDTKEVTATKKRICKDKKFSWSGDRENTGLFGQTACRGSGKYITITEGELDALAVSEMFDNRWDVVSIRDGCSSAARDIKAQLEFLEGYDNVVLCFDNDEQGRAATDAVKDLFSPNKVKVATLPMKDAGAMLAAGRVKDFTKAWWDAKSYEPVGIVRVTDTWDEVLKYRDTPSVPYPWEGLNDILQGMRTKEVVVWAADTGIGKSQTMREVQDHVVNVTEDRVGCLMLEESIAKTTLGWMSFKAERPLHKELGTIPDEELRKYWEAATRDDRFVLLDHNGWNNDFNILKARVRYMAKALDCRWIVLDHLHYALSSVQGASGDWAGIDELMTEIVSLAIECDIGIHLVSHTSGDRNLRGSKGISKLADAVIFLERDKHHEDPLIANCTQVIVDKNRWAGDIGTACWLQYDPMTNRMKETSPPIDDGGEEEF